MKVILFNSPIYIKKNDTNEDYLPPIGQGYIATYLKKNNVNVELIDCVFEHLGLTEIINLIKDKKPTYVGINIFTPNMQIVKEIVEKCEVKTSFIIGGQAVKFIYNDILEWNTKNIMYIIIGEGEYIINAIVNGAIEEKIFIEYKNKKVYFIDSNSLYFPKDISCISLDRSFFKDREIFNLYGEIEASIVTSRGCIYDCAFCGGARSLNNDIIPRERNEMSIINEINDIINRNPNVRSIRILDDLFLKNRDNILKAIKIFRNYKNLSWRAMAHIQSFNNSEYLLSELRKSGCKELFIGIESGSIEVRKRIKKIGNIEEVKRIICKVMENGINVKGYFIYGFPDEEICDFNATYNLARQLKEISLSLPGNFRCSVFQFRPYHGTELYNEILKRYGNIEKCSLNTDISIFKGRTQFNYQSGNYSKCTDEEINKFIIKTLNLNNGE